MAKLLIYYHLVIRKVWLSMNNFFCVLSFTFLCFSQIVVWSKFYDEKINYKNILLYVSLLIMFLLGIFNYFYINVSFRMILAMFLFFICNFLIFKKNVNQIVSSTIFTQFLMVLSDIFVSLILMSLFKIDFKSIREGHIVTYMGNVFVSIILMLICRIHFIKSFYSKLIILTDKIKSQTLLLICLFVIIIINYIMVSTFYEVGSILIIIINSILIFIYVFIIYRSLREKNSRLVVQAQNDSLMESLHQYEDMVDRQRVDNHENKNQLLIIKNMIKKNDKDVVKYIETIVKDQMEDDEALYTSVMTIPSGGLQGIIYQKMLVMKDEHIKFSLDVGRGVREIELDKLSMNDNYRLCKIVGVFLDNAIEESRKIDDKCIMISLFVDDGELVIEVSNKFNGKIDMDRLDESGYTTKGDGHGYGLSLVKKILSETNVFENERSIKRNVFKQVIRIKNT